MTNGINKAIILGNVGKDPEVRYLSNGTATARFSIATGESWKDKESGEKKESTEWHHIVMWGKLAEICREYVKKGSKVYVEGKIKTRKWQDKNTGQDRYITEIVGETIQLLGSAVSGGSIEKNEKDHTESDDEIPF